MTEKLNTGIEKTKEWFEVAIPNPTKDKQRVQLGVHIEEFLEMLDAIEIPYILDEVKNLKESLFKVSNIVKTDPKANIIVKSRKELLDAMADQIVTATGVSHMYGLDVVGALDEVNESNFSKFIDGKPVFNEHGKIGKGMFYKKPNLEPFVGVDPVQ